MHNRADVPLLAVVAAFVAIVFVTIPASSWGSAAFWTAAFTFALTVSTFLQWRETRRLAIGADNQSEKMAASISEAARAATAMEGVASSLAVTAANSVEVLGAVSRQMRAYITIGNGQLYVQNSQTGFRFQMDVGVVNVGLTPARNVAVSFRIDILTLPLPPEFDLTTPEPPARDSTLNPRHPYSFAVVADHTYPEDLIWKSIIVGQGYALYVWGTIWYDDVTGTRRHQNYCQWCHWRDAGQSVWINAPRHNDGT